MSNMNLNNPWRSIRLIGYRDAIMNVAVGLVCGFPGDDLEPDVYRWWLPVLAVVGMALVAIVVALVVWR